MVFAEFDSRRRANIENAKKDLANLDQGILPSVENSRFEQQWLQHCKDFVLTANAANLKQISKAASSGNMNDNSFVLGGNGSVFDNSFAVPTVASTVIPPGASVATAAVEVKRWDENNKKAYTAFKLFFLGHMTISVAERNKRISSSLWFNIQCYLCHKDKRKLYKSSTWTGAGHQSGVE